MVELEGWYDKDGNGQMEFKCSWELPEGQEHKLGSLARSTVDGQEHVCDIVTDWDKTISRFHAHLVWDGNTLHVRRRKEKTQNEIIFQGREQVEFTCGPGESFSIGRTTFRVPANETAALTRGRFDVRNLRFLNPDARLEALSELPEVLRYGMSEQELQARLLQVLLKGIPQADAAAIITLDRERSTAENPLVSVRAVEMRHGSAEEVRPSRKLIYKALVADQSSVIHVWDQLALSAAGSPGFTLPPSSGFTIRGGTDWAICYPFFDEMPPRQGLYVSGKLNKMFHSSDSLERDQELNSDLKFTALTAEVYSSLRQALHLQNTCSRLGQFLAPVVVAEVLAGSKSIEDIFRRELTDVTVLFCDLRGFSRKVEGGSDDLEAVWDDISSALDSMTEPIVQHRGVIGDFQGDAAMGFWGWPEKRPDTITAGAQAALAIRRSFDLAAQRRGKDGGALSCGIGLAHGKAIAGLLGAFAQKKVGVFGPVVNLAARLESMTKHFKASILIDQGVARELNQPAHGTWCRIRELATVRPVGFEHAVNVSELLPPVNHPVNNLPEPLRRQYGSALQKFQSGDWGGAVKILNLMIQQDPASQFLKSYIDEHGGKPPAGWNGVIPMKQK